ncbi:MAG: RNA polymerase sigma factor [Lachnospiraceae bacterium]|nr:RNA polymerase sigma factor [Lachnospiraceae bacterium]MBQ8317312.1 RNA polymerase sigma factor [Lachnospiraceae bacterium]
MSNKATNADLENTILKYSDLLYRICFLILKNEQDVGDVIQETFILYMKKHPDFESEEKKKAWLIKVSQNKCKDFLRFHKRHSYVPLDEVEDILMGTSDVEPSYKVQLEEIWELDYKLKSVVILYYIEGYSIKETAQMLAISESACKKRLERARNKLKEML